MTDTSVSNTSTPGGDFAPRSTPGTPPAAAALFVLTIPAPTAASGNDLAQISNILRGVERQVQIGVNRGNCVVGNLVGTFTYRYHRYLKTRSDAQCPPNPVARGADRRQTMPTILTLTINARPALETKYQERKWLEELLHDAAHDLGKGGVITSPILDRAAPKTAVGTIVWGPDALNP